MRLRSGLAKAQRFLAPSAKDRRAFSAELRGILCRMCLVPLPTRPCCAPLRLGGKLDVQRSGTTRSGSGRVGSCARRFAPEHAECVGDASRLADTRPVVCQRVGVRTRCSTRTETASGRLATRSGKRAVGCAWTCAAWLAVEESRLYQAKFAAWRWEQLTWMTEI